MKGVTFQYINRCMILLQQQLISWEDQKSVVSNINNFLRFIGVDTMRRLCDYKRVGRNMGVTE